MLDLTGNMLAEATTAATESAGWTISVAIMSCSVIIIGATTNIAWIGSRAANAIGRQPEAKGQIFTAMVVAAALVEGVTFFALLICFLTLFWLR